MTKLYRISGAAKQVGLHPATLRRYENMGLLEVQRDESGQRVYMEDDIRQIRKIWAELNLKEMQ